MRTSTLIKTTPILLAVALAALTALPGAATVTVPPTALEATPLVAETETGSASQQGFVSVTDSGYQDGTTVGPVTAAAVGETVTWVWAGFQAHTVTHGVDPTVDGVVGEPLAGSFGSALQNSGSYSHTFTESGVFVYYCTVHASMRGAVVVA